MSYVVEYQKVGRRRLRTFVVTCDACKVEWRRAPQRGPVPKHCTTCRRGPYRSGATHLPERPVVTATVGPCRCQGCGEPVWWARRATRSKGVQVYRAAWREEDGTMHRCPNIGTVAA